MSFLLNNHVSLSNENEFRQFGADDICEIRMMIEKNTLLKYWVKIIWIETPKNYEGSRCGLRDPFYCEWESSNGTLKVNHVLFGDNGQCDMDFDLRINSDIDWIYDVRGRDNTRL